MNYDRSKFDDEVIKSYRQVVTGKDGQFILDYLALENCYLRHRLKRLETGFFMCYGLIVLIIMVIYFSLVIK